MVHPAAAAARQLSDAFEKQAKEHEALKSHFDQLKEDFSYNLRLLEERDKDLANYDKAYQQLKDEYQRKQREQVTLQAALEEAKRLSASEAQKASEMEDAWGTRLKNLEEEMLSKIGEKEQQLQDNHSAFNNEKLAMEKRILEEKERTDKFQREIKAEYDRTNEKVIRDLQDSIATEKARILEEESFRSQAEAQTKHVQERCQVLEQELEAARKSLREVELREKELGWKLSEVKREAEEKVTNLKWEIEHKKANMVATIEQFERKVGVLSEGINKQEHAVLRREQDTLRQQAVAREAVARAQLDSRNVKLALEELERRHRSEVADLVREVERLHAGIRRIKSEFQTTRGRNAQELVLRDKEIESLQNSLAKTEAEANRATLELERFKVSLKQAIECEKEAKERLKALQETQAAELSNQNRQAKSESNQLTQTLLMERREVENKLNEAEKLIDQQKRVLVAVQSERMDALQLAQEWKRKAVNGDQGESLLEENEKLRSAIKEMRLAMETTAATATTRGSDVREDIRETTIALNDRINSLQSQLRDEHGKLSAAKEQLSASKAQQRVANDEVRRLRVEISDAQQKVTESLKLSAHRASELGRLQAALATCRASFDPNGTVSGDELSRLLDLIGGGVDRALAAHVSEVEAVGNTQTVSPSDAQTQRKLEAALESVEKLKKDRDELEELNNSLRGSLRLDSARKHPDQQSFQSPHQRHKSPQHRYRTSLVSSVESDGLKEVFKLLESGDQLNFSDISEISIPDHSDGTATSQHKDDKSEESHGPKSNSPAKSKSKKSSNTSYGDEKKALSRKKPSRQVRNYAVKD